MRCDETATLASMPDSASDQELIDAMRTHVADARTRLASSLAAGNGEAAWESALVALSARGRFGIRLGLGRARSLLRALGSPEQGVRGALIAGTNGKGSVGALISAALGAAGIRHATTPSPHLVSYRERLMIDGRPIAPLPFAQAIDRALAAADEIEASVGPTTEFELLVGAIFDALRSEEIKVAAVEVGMGGRLDAMHAWDGGVAVITNVGLDHQKYLGDTIAQIAAEKAAIIVRGDRAVAGDTDRVEVLDAVRHRAARVGAPLRIARAGAVTSLGRRGIEVELEGYGVVPVGLIGRHQAANAAVAAATVDALRDAGIVDVSVAALRTGFAAVRWPGRMELIEGAFGTPTPRDLLLDGAHNPDGAAALADGIDDLGDDLRGAGNLTLIFAAMADKEVDAVCRALAASERLRGAALICTSVGDARSMPPDELAKVARAAGLGASSVTASDPSAALRAAATHHGPVVVAGSLYLVGAVRAHLMRTGVLPDEGLV